MTIKQWLITHQPDITCADVEERNKVILLLTGIGFESCFPKSEVIKDTDLVVCVSELADYGLQGYTIGNYLQITGNQFLVFVTSGIVFTISDKVTVDLPVEVEPISDNKSDTWVLHNWVKYLIASSIANVVLFIMFMFVLDTSNVHIWGFWCRVFFVSFLVVINGVIGIILFGEDSKTSNNG